MLYTQDETAEIILKIYDYFRIRMKIQPRCIKVDKPLHQGWINIFIKLLPPNAGVDYIWNFLSYQFYIYANQDQKLRPTPAWFLGKEAIRRWLQYDDGAKWYAQEWISKMKFSNPISDKTYLPISEDSLLIERYRMSRVAGANFCEMKYGDNPYNGDMKVCYTCPHEKICENIYVPVRNGRSVSDKIKDVGNSNIYKTNVNIIELNLSNNYFNEIDEED